MDGDHLGALHRPGRAPGRSARDQGGVLHAARSAGAPGRVHDRESGVRISAQDLSVTGERRLGRLEVAVRLRGVLGLKEERQLDVAETGFAERILEDPIAGVRRPGEVVDAVLLVAVEHASARGGSLVGAAAGGAELAPVALGEVDRDVVVAEIREELARGVELVAVPAVFLEDAELGEPLDDHEEIVLVAGPHGHPRQPRDELDRDRDRLSGLDGLAQDDLRDRPVVGIAVVGRDVAQGRQKVGAVGTGHPADLDRAPGMRQRAVAADAARLLPERRKRVAEGVQVEVEAERGSRPRRRVLPRHDLGSLDGLLLDVQPAGDLVRGDRRRERTGEGRSR